MKKSILFLAIIVICFSNSAGAVTPIITDISPGIFNNDSAVAVTINGSNFDSSSKVYYKAGVIVRTKLDTPSFAYGVFVYNNYSFIADGVAGLHIADISDPVKPVIISTVKTSGSANGVYVLDNYAYVADGEGGLQIVDISNPVSSGIVGTIDTPGKATGVCVSGNYAYLADDVKGLQVIDITYPANLKIVANLNSFGSACGIFLSGKYAYIAAGYSGLQIIDISNPEDPKVAGSIGLSSSVKGVFVKDKYAYVAAEYFGLQIIDISNPRKPLKVSKVDAPGSAIGIDVEGDYAYMANSGSGLFIIDIKNPKTPGIIAQEDTDGWASGISVKNGYAYVADGSSGLLILEVSKPELNSCVTGSISVPLSEGLCVSDNKAYLISDTSTIKIIDVKNPNIPAVIGEIKTSGAVKAICAAGDYVYTGDQKAGLQILKINNPKKPELISIVNITSISTMCVAENYLYVVGKESGFQIIDVKNPANPNILGGLNNLDKGENIFVSGRYVYIACGDSGLKIVDASDPAHPKKISEINTSAYANGVYIKGNYAYVSNASAGLQIIDITERNNPKIIKNIDIPGYASGVYVNNKYAYVANKQKGFNVIAIADPFNPVMIGEQKVGKINNITGVGDYIYVGNKRFDIIHGLSAGAECDEVTFVNDTALSVVIPAGLQIARYNIKVINSFNESVEFNNAFEVSPIVLKNHNPDSKAIVKNQLSKVSISAKPDSGQIPLAVNFSADVQNVSGEIKYEWDLNGDGKYEETTTNNTINITYNLPGEYSVRIRVTDNNGTVTEDSTMVKVQKTNSKPLLMAIGDKTVEENQLIEFSISGTDPDGDKLVYKAKNLPAGASFDSKTNKFSWKPSYNQSGIHKGISFEVSDGKLSDTEEISIVVDNVNQLPEVTLTGIPTEGNEPLNVDFTANGQDNDGTLILYDWDLDGDGNYETITTDNKISMVYNKSGTYIARVEVMDNDGGKAQDKKSINVISVNKPPVLAALGNKTIEENQLIEFLISGTDRDGDKLTYKAQNLPQGASFDIKTNIFSWKPNYNQSGIYRVYFEVSDGKLNASEEISITVNNINQLPKVTLINNTGEGNVPLKVEFMADGQDIDGTISKYRWDLDGDIGYETTTTVNKISKVYNLAGIYFTRVEVVDNNGGTAQAVLQFNVKKRESSKVILVADKPEGTAPLNIIFTAKVEDPDADTINYNWDLNGDGVFEKSTKVNTISYVYNYAGDYIVKVKATDNNNNLMEAATIISIKSLKGNNDSEYDTVLIKPEVKDSNNFLHIFKESIGAKPGDAKWNELVDLNRNNIIDGGDLAIFLKIQNNGD